MRFVCCPSMPVKRPDGDMVHALRSFNAPNILMVSRIAYMTFRKYKTAPDTLTDDDKQFLNICLTQAEALRKR